MKKISLITLLFLLTNMVFGQNYNLPEKNFYKNAKVALLDFSRYEVSDLKILNDSIEYTNKFTNRNEIISIQQINYLRVQKGNKMGECALYGGLLMGVSVLYAVISINSDPNRVLKDNAGEIFTGFIAGGVIIGGIIGATIPKWETYFVNDETGLINNVKPDLFIGQNSIGLKIQLTIN